MIKISKDYHSYSINVFVKENFCAVRMHGSTGCDATIHDSHFCEEDLRPLAPFFSTSFCTAPSLF